jgi:hypothetical protein
MPYATYVARTKLITGHVASVTYTFQFALSNFEERIENLRERPRSLAGNAETLYYGTIRKFSVTFMPIPAIEMPLFEEFLFSTADGQTFVFDPYGIPDAPRMPLLVDREDNGHTKQRLTMTDDPLNSDYFEFSIELSER